jgi:UDP-N-acetylglucosamine--N-acetylmuramyl-(pentapeptide) pyrophosphoryl-undecaprenol N-acetylglucosamine transferase
MGRLGGGMKTIVIMAGGTGGHIMPGLAVADYLRRHGWKVVWMGNPEGMEARLVPEYGYETAWVKFSALRGKGLLRKFMLPINLLKGFAQALGHFKRIKPDVVLGLGGFISFPGGMMAVLKGIPLVLHEQNSIPGLANKVLARVADRVLTGFPDALPKGQWVGNPVRHPIAVLPAPSFRYGQREGRLRILVIGGSLGAQALNEAMPQALALMTPDERPEVRHQAGEKHIEALRSAYAAAGVEAQTLAFIDDMAEAYGWADLVICRAGALTVAELAAAGVASVLVPYPHAVDDHQTANARFLSHAGAAMLLPQAELTAERLVLIRNLTRAQLLEMAEKARELALPDAAETVAKICWEVAS